MIKLIQRTTDNKYLKSVETETWVDNVKEAFEMTYKEYNTSKETLLNTYTEEQLNENYEKFLNFIRRLSSFIFVRFNFY